MHFLKEMTFLGKLLWEVVVEKIDFYTIFPIFWPFLPIFGHFLTFLLVLVHFHFALWGRFLAIFPIFFSEGANCAADIMRRRSAGPLAAL